MGIIRILFLADTHLGFDLPFRPRIQRRRRGPEFFANFERALRPALQGRVDCVVHGGDLLYRSKVPPRLVAMAFEPLKQVADQGTPVYLIPGNHERSAIPHSHLAEHPEIHIFDRPRTYLLRKDDLTLALAGFPFVRHGIRSKFLYRLDQVSRRHTDADVQVLCVHQSIDRWGHRGTRRLYVSPCNGCYQGIRYSGKIFGCAFRPYSPLSGPGKGP